MVDVCAAGIYDSVTPPSTLPENPAKNSGSTDQVYEQDGLKEAVLIPYPAPSAVTQQMGVAGQPSLSSMLTWQKLGR